MGISVSVLGSVFQSVIVSQLAAIVFSHDSSGDVDCSALGSKLGKVGRACKVCKACKAYCFYCCHLPE